MKKKRKKKMNQMEVLVQPNQMRMNMEMRKVEELALVVAEVVTKMMIIGSVIPQHPQQTQAKRRSLA